MVPNPSSTVFPMGKKKKQRIMVLCGEHKGGGPLRAPPKRGALNPAEERWGGQGNFSVKMSPDTVVIKF